MLHHSSCIFPFTTLCPPTSTLFPSTTLFRSALAPEQLDHRPVRLVDNPIAGGPDGALGERLKDLEPPDDRGETDANEIEEHTSKLQSRFDLVCRLLLEKKKKQHNCPWHYTTT